jgi:hypothetical protein
MAGAIKAIIATQFDATGIKKATREFDKLGKSLRNTLGAVGLTVGLAAITNGLRESAKAAVADVKSQALLAQQLRNTVGATDEAIASTEDYIKSLMLETSVADDQLRPALASLVRATGDVGKAQDLLALSTDIAAGTGRDLGAVSVAVGKAAAGQTTQLFRLIPALKGSKDFARDAGIAFGGMAAAAANNDPFQRINIILGEMQEEIGMALLPTLNDFAAWFASPEGQAKLQEFVDFTTDAIDGVIKLANYIGENIKVLGPLAIGIGVASTAFSVFNAVLNANPIVRIIGLVGLLAGALLGLGAASGAASTGVPATVISRAMKAGQEAADETAKRFRTGSKEQGAAVAAARKRAYDMVLKNYQTGIDALKTGVSNAEPIIVPPIVEQLGGSKSGGKSVITAIDKAADKQKELVADFTQNIKDLSEGFRDLGRATQELGQFEQQAVDSFEAINQAVVKGLGDEALTEAAANFIYDYIKVEKVALTALARQRDILLSKIAIAQDISRGVVNAANITGLLTNETRQVTKSVKTLVNGIATTISSTYDEVITGNLADSFKKLVDRTKNFAKNLVALRKLGLNGTLFKQIVDAGAEAGGATAEAIIAGGADTVSELNGLFDELNKAGSDIAAESTDVFYNLGEGVSNAFIDGLKSQEAILAAQIAAMVASIEAAFAAMMARLNQLGAAPMTNANGFAYETALPGVSGSAMQFGSATPWAQAVASFRESQTPTVNNYITVKAGAIVAEKSAGQLITSLQNKYTKASG